MCVSERHVSSPRPLGVHHSLRDALPVKVRQGLDQCVILCTHTRALWWDRHECQSVALCGRCCTLTNVHEMTNAPETLTCSSSGPRLPTLKLSSPLVMGLPLVTARFCVV